MNGAIIGLGHGERVISRAFRFEKIKLLGVCDLDLDKAKNCRSETNEVIIVEGYMDVIGLTKNKIENCVANLGTALTAVSYTHLTLPTIYSV